MLVKQFSNIVQRFCMSEINKVIGKYSRVSNDDINIIERLIRKIDNEELKEELYENFDETLKIAKELEDVHGDNQSEIIFMYLGIKRNTTLKFSIEEVMEYYEKLKYNDYILLDEGHLIYKKDSNLKSLARMLLEEMLEDEWHIDRLLEKDTLVSYWLEGVSKEEAINELIGDIEVDELLNLEPVSIYENEINEYLYSEVEV